MLRGWRLGRSCLRSVACCTAVAALGLPLGTALGEYYESDDWATETHGGTDFALDTSVTYMISGGQWKVTMTDSFFTVYGSGSLLCSRNRLLANGVLKQDKNWGFLPFQWIARTVDSTTTSPTPWRTGRTSA